MKYALLLGGNLFMLGMLYSVVSPIAGPTAKILAIIVALTLFPGVWLFCRYPNVGGSFRGTAPIALGLLLPQWLLFATMLLNHLSTGMIAVVVMLQFGMLAPTAISVQGINEALKRATPQE